MYKLKSIAISAAMVTATLLATGSAHADLISVDSGYGANTITLDEVNNLEWLDFTESTQYSFNEAAAQFGNGGDFEGFRHATWAEINLLTAQAGGTIPGADPTNKPAITLLQDLLGITRSWAAGIGELNTKTAAWFDDGDHPDNFSPDLPGMAQWIIYNDGVSFGSNPHYYAEVSDPHDTDSTKDKSVSHIGNALVRTGTLTPVPVPGAAILGFIGMGTAATVLRRRRKKVAA